MKLSFEYKGTKISYDLMYKKTTAISINIDSNNNVNVVAPLGTSVQTVMDKVKGNAPWIINELYQSTHQNSKGTLFKQYAYLGKNYSVEIVDNKEADTITVKLLRGKFVIQTPTDSEKEIREALIMWYKDKVSAKLKERLKVYAESFKKAPEMIIVNTDENELFGVRDNIFYVSVAVGMLSIELIDYLVVNALCRLNGLKEPHESMKKLKEVLPDYEEYRKWLEKNKAELLL
jgi:predicted metal-dependent hydrolase